MPYKQYFRNPLSQREYWGSDTLFVLVVLTINVFYWCVPERRELVLNTYFLPIVVGGILLGWTRALALAFLACTFVLLTHWCEYDSGSYISLAAWSITLSVTGGFIGMVVADRDYCFSKILEIETANATTDPLTGVSNRRGFDEQLSTRFSQEQQDGHQFWALMIDIDRFKTFNDRYGHKTGDHVLQSVAARIRETIRDVDLVARYGGEEFCVLLSSAGAERAKHVAERIRHSVESMELESDGSQLQITVSVGAACLLDAESATEVVSAADAALYQAKLAGRNLVRQKLGSPDCTPTELTSHSGFYRDAQSGSSMSDSVTGLPSRKSFDVELRRRVMEVNRYDSVVSGMLQFPQIAKFQNPDQIEIVVCHVVDRARRVLRETDIMTWYDETRLCVIFPHTRTSDSAIALARILEEIGTSSYPIYQNQELKFEVGAKVADVIPADTVDEVIRRVERSTISTDSASNASPETNAAVS